MEEWKHITNPEIASIEKVVALFQPWAMAKFPDPKIKIKILEDAQGGFSGVPNVVARKKVDGSPDWVVGRGENIAQALEATLILLLASIDQQEASQEVEEDFFWVPPIEF